VKIRPVGAELFHEDGGTHNTERHITKPIVAFRNFAKVPKTKVVQKLTR